MQVIQFEPVRGIRTYRSSCSPAGRPDIRHLPCQVQTISKAERRLFKTSPAGKFPLRLSRKRSTHAICESLRSIPADIDDRAITISVSRLPFGKFRIPDESELGILPHKDFRFVLRIAPSVPYAVASYLIVIQKRRILGIGNFILAHIVTAGQMHIMLILDIRIIPSFFSFRTAHPEIPQSITLKLISTLLVDNHLNDVRMLVIHRQ